jgi:hypothetical protein
MHKLQGVVYCQNDTEGTSRRLRGKFLTFILMYFSLYCTFYCMLYVFSFVQNPSFFLFFLKGTMSGVS